MIGLQGDTVFSSILFLVLSEFDYKSKLRGETNTNIPSMPEHPGQSGYLPHCRTKRSRRQERYRYRLE
jgi:hypothetical protein